MMHLYWAKVRPHAVIPTKRIEDAGYDLYPCFDEDFLEIGPWETKLVPLGVASAFDSNYVMILKERGSTGTRGIAQRCGVIDSEYRGEYMAPVTNLNPKPLRIVKQNAIAQQPKEVVVYPYEKAVAQGVMLVMPQVESEEISMEALNQIESQRKDGKLGSSGK